MKNWRARPSSRCKTLIMLWCSGKRKRKEKREGKGGKCFFCEGEEDRSILFEGKYLVRVGEDKEQRRKRRKIFDLRRKKRTEKKKEETIWSLEEKKSRNGKGGNYLKREKYW